MAKKKNEESILQSQCVRWFRLQYPKLVLLAIPNGAKLFGDTKQRAMQWNRLESEGAMVGAADLCLFVPSGVYGALFIEMKTPKGKQSENQKTFESKVVAAGYAYAVPKTFEEFTRIVKSYIETGEF
jgi:hypothetical protein